MDTVRSYLRSFSYQPKNRTFAALSVSGVLAALGLIAPKWDVAYAQAVSICFFTAGGSAAIIGARSISEDREEMAIAEISKETRAGLAAEMLVTEEELESAAIQAKIYNPSADDTQAVEETSSTLPPPEQPPIFYYG